MSKITRINLRQLFSKGAKPAQEAFYNWMDSFWHKDDQIDLDAIKGLQTSLDKKLDVGAQDTILGAFNNLRTELTATVKTGYLSYLKKADPRPVDGWKVGLYKLIEIGSYTNLTPAKNEVGNAITITAVDQKINEAYWNGTFWSKSEISIPGTTAKQVYDPNDNTSPASMKAAETYQLTNSKRFMQVVINDSIQGNQTEVVKYGKGTNYSKIVQSNNLWVGQRVIRKSGVLKSISINALKATRFKFARVEFTSSTTVKIIDYINIDTQLGIKDYLVPGNITLTSNQDLFLSCNQSGMIGYDDNTEIVGSELMEFTTPTGQPDEQNIKKYPGYAAWQINVEVHFGRDPFSVDEMMLSLHNTIKGVGNEYVDFTTEVNIDKTKEVKYTKLEGLTEFKKGIEGVIDKTVTYKLTGGSIIFTTAFLPLENSKDYNPTKTNIISFFKQHGKIRYTNEVLPLEPI